MRRKCSVSTYKYDCTFNVLKSNTLLIFMPGYEGSMLLQGLVMVYKARLLRRTQKKKKQHWSLPFICLKISLVLA